MRPWHKESGLTPVGAAVADLALPHALELVRAAGSENMARVALGEAIFREFDLPTRTPAYRAAYLKANARRES